jgi:hypothetical protein
MALYNLDGRYCAMYTGVQYSCAGDGIVGLTAQRYRGGFELPVLNGPNHFGETSSIEVHNRMVPLFGAGGALAIP